MQPHELDAAGRALFGGHWQTRMARALGVNPRTVRRWASGETAVPKGVAAWLEARMHHGQARR